MERAQHTVGAKQIILPLRVCAILNAALNRVDDASGGTGRKEEVATKS